MKKKKILNNCAAKMVKGRSVRCPTVRWKRIRPCDHTSQAFQQLTEMETVEMQWTQTQCNKLHDTLHGEALAHPPAWEGSPVPFDHLDEAQLDINLDVNKAPTEQNPPVHNHQDHISSTQYKTRRIREEENWEKISKPMFIVYQKASALTSDWGNPNTWNEDRNVACPCTASMLRM